VFSISVLEVLALDLPVITWDLPYSREFATNAVVRVNSFNEFIEVLKYLLTNDDTRDAEMRRRVSIRLIKDH